MKKMALITGSSRGIGKAIAVKLAQSGYQIILHGTHRSDNLIATERKIKQLGMHALTTYFDVSDNTSVTSACSAMLKKYEAVDIVVNNAGIMMDSQLLTMSEEQWDSVIKTDLYGPFYVIKQLLAGMKSKKWGRIINISSIAERGAFGKSNYAAAKAGIIAMTKSLALEVGRDNITVNAVCPGYIKTALSLSIPAKYQEQFLSEIALKRIGTPEEVANVVNFLASNESSYITGAVIDVNGGWQ
jgi:NAD(P)-dependent dehydrogenase (short-subunit alcohol dehydrogenase family)